MSSDPLVSVIIPTYNRPNLIKRSIQSVLDQTYANFELIVVDDGSSEDVRESVEQFSDERIQFIRHEENRNANAARNTGIRNSSGDYVAFLDDDDVWLPWKLRFQVRMLEGTPDDIGILVSSIFIVDVFSDEFSLFVAKERGSSSFLGLPSRWLIKKDAIRDVGPFDTEMPTMQDLEFSARLLDSYDPVYDSLPVALYYQRTERTNIEGREKLLTKHGEKM